MPRLALATTLALLGALACGQDGAPNRPDYVGTFELRSVNGQPLPFSYPSGDGTYTVYSGALVLLQEEAGALGDSVIFRSGSETRNVVNASYLVYRIPSYGRILVSCAPGSTCRLGTSGMLTLVMDGSGAGLTITRTEGDKVYLYARTR